MKAYLVWMLVTTMPQYAGFVSYSPPITTLEQCDHLRVSIPSEYVRRFSRCIQVEILK